jgi:transcription elongation factor Elf1
MFDRSLDRGLRADPARSGRGELPSATRTLFRCLVCGSSEVRTDEVIDRGVVLLAECPHCDHRWTRTLADVAPLSVRCASPVREVASAA